MPTALIYTRISNDANDTREGVDRQQALCERLVADRGFTLEGSFEDNDISGYKRKTRPGWTAVQERIAAGGIDYLVAYANDRLTRHMRELEDLIDLLERTGTQVVTVSSGEFDLATPEGRMTARIIGSVARQESERKSVRQRDANAAKAAKGERVGGRRPFGYEQDGNTIREDEAAIIRDLARRVIDGASIRSLRIELNGRGVKTSAGNDWTNARLSYVLRNPRYIGKRTYKKEIVGDAVWPAIIDDSTWTQLQAVLTNPARAFKGGPLKRWMTRVANCGKCGKPLVAASVSKTRGASYTCSTDGGCLGISIRAPQLEEHTSGLIVAALSDPSAVSRFVADDVDDEAAKLITGQLADVARRLDEADADYDNGEIDRERWLARSQRLKARRTALTAERDRMLRSSTVDLLPSGDVQGWWDDLAAEQRRSIARLLFSDVEVRPARNLGGKIDWERIVTTWAA